MQDAELERWKRDQVQKAEGKAPQGADPKTTRYHQISMIFECF